MSRTVIGLTGPTGAGKSTVADALRGLGCAVVDADRIARSAAELPGCRARLRKSFGGGIFRADGSLDRRSLAEAAFSSPESTRLLNEATHPAILAECARRIAEARESSCRAVILDAPLLFECGAESLCAATIAVLAPEDSRLKRIMARDGIAEDAARARMAAQHGEDYYRSRADYLFDGDMPRERLRSAAQTLLEKILEEAHE